MSTTKATAVSTASASTTSAPARPSRRTRSLAVLGAAAATLTVWAVAGPLADVDLSVRLGSATAQHIGPATVAIMTILAGLAAWGLLTVLERFTPRARTLWTTIALITLALSLTRPPQRRSQHAHEGGTGKHAPSRRRGPNPHADPQKLQLAAAPGPDATLPGPGPGRDLTALQTTPQETPDGAPQAASPRSHRRVHPGLGDTGPGSGRDDLHPLRDLPRARAARPIPDREATCRYGQSKVVQAQANIRCELLGLYLNGDTVIAVPCGDNGRLPWTRRYLGHHRPHLTFVSPTTGRFRWPCRTA